MGLYVEVTCDVRSWVPLSDSAIHHRCWSNENNNPQGNTVAGARREARRQGWLVKGSYAVCPGCLEVSKEK